MSRYTLAARPGMTLPEVLTALVLMGIIGAAVTGVFVSQSQFHAQQETASAARNVTRGAVNMMLSDLRTLERSGAIEGASSSAIIVHAPIAFGIICGHDGAAPNLATVVSRLPSDTMTFKAAVDGVYSGHMWLNRRTQQWSGRHTVSSGTQPAPGYAPTAVSLCLNATTPMPDGTNAPAAIRVLHVDSGGGVYRLRPRLMNGGNDAPVGATVAMLQRITYEFKASTLVPGAIGLFRTTGAVEEEIAAPFAATARFRFYVNDALTAQDAVPTPLSAITGIELVLDAVSQRPGPGGTFPVMPYSTSVFFRNRL